MLQQSETTKRAITLLRDCTDHNDSSIQELGDILSGAIGVKDLVEKEFPLYQFGTATIVGTMKLSRVRSGSTYNYWLTSVVDTKDMTYDFQPTPIPNSSNPESASYLDWFDFVLDDGTLFPELNNYIGSELFSVGGVIQKIWNGTTSASLAGGTIIIGFEQNKIVIEAIDSILALQPSDSITKMGVTQVLVL